MGTAPGARCSAFGASGTTRGSPTTASKGCFMPEVLAKGVDISEFQHENLIDWGYARAELSIRFAYVRACYGMRLDKLTPRHIARIRAGGVCIAVYAVLRVILKAGKQLEVL